MPNTNLKFRDSQEVNRGTLRLEGRFRPNGGSAVDNSLNVGRAFTATWISTGTFDILLQAPARSVLSFVTQLQLAALGNRRVEVRTLTQNTDGTWTIRIVVTDLTNTTPVVQDIASAANSWIHFSASLQLVAP